MSPCCCEALRAFHQAFTSAESVPSAGTMDRSNTPASCPVSSSSLLGVAGKAWSILSRAVICASTSSATASARRIRSATSPMAGDGAVPSIACCGPINGGGERVRPDREPVLRGHILSGPQHRLGVTDTARRVPQQ